MEEEQYFRWNSGLAWFGTTLGCSLWMGISAAVLSVRGSPVEGSILGALFLAATVLSAAFWKWRSRITAYFAWQAWFVFLWAVSLAAVATLQWTGAYPKVNLNAWGMVFMWIGVGVGIPLLMLDFYARHKTNGRRNLFGAIFDFLAGFS